MEVKHGTLHPTRLGERKRAYPGSSPTPQQQRYTFDNRRYLWNLTVDRFGSADRKILRSHRTWAGDDISVHDAVLKEITSKGDPSLFLVRVEFTLKLRQNYGTTPEDRNFSGTKCIEE